MTREEQAELYAQMMIELEDEHPEMDFESRSDIAQIKVDVEVERRQVKP